MADDGRLLDGAPSSRLRTVVFPLALLVLIVAIVSALVLSGTVQGDRPRVGPEQAPTTVSTIEITP